MNGLGRRLSGSPDHPAVLFLHGFMGTSADWKDVVTTVGDRAFCIAPDLPGHGTALGLTPEAYTIEGSAQAVVRTLDELEIERWTNEALEAAGTALEESAGVWNEDLEKQIRESLEHSLDSLHHLEIVIPALPPIPRTQ